MSLEPHRNYKNLSAVSKTGKLEYQSDQESLLVLSAFSGRAQY